MSEVSKKSIVEALIFAAPSPIPQSKLVSIANLDSKNELIRIVDSLNEEYSKLGRSFRINPIAGGYQFYTIKAMAPYLREVFSIKNTPRLSRPMLDILGIIALRQPVTKPVIDKIRSADSGGPLHRLLESGLITVRGREKGPGRPFFYGTTREFLRFFGLERIEDLPSETELANLFSDKEFDSEYDESEKQIKIEEEDTINDPE
ncbi:SMC-Scp complex subunit ScpB [bacterium]|nr:SMC-Scp complex subunit ScpB [bacterium]